MESDNYFVITWIDTPGVGRIF